MSKGGSSSLKLVFVVVPICGETVAIARTGRGVTENRILRRAEVERRTGFKRAHLYDLIKKRKFPRPLRLGKRAVGWKADEVNHWIATRRKRRMCKRARAK